MSLIRRERVFKGWSKVFEVVVRCKWKRRESIVIFVGMYVSVVWFCVELR